MRVHVIGGPGTGKTTVGGTIAPVLGLTLVELDRAIAYRPPSGTPDAPFASWDRVSWDDRLAAAHALADQPAWVSEGIYAGWTESLVARADVVIWLDLAGWRAAASVLQRQLGRVRHRHPDRYGWGDALRLAWRAGIGFRHGRAASIDELRERDRANSAATTAAFLATYSSRVIRCRTRKATRQAISAVLADA